MAVSVLTLFEVAIAALHRTGSTTKAEEAVEETKSSVQTIIPVTAEIVQRALDVRAASSARIATVDILIAATAAHLGSVLVHRDPHFVALPSGYLHEALPNKDP